MTVQTYFKNLGIVVSRIERIGPFPVILYMINKSIEIYTQVGFQKSLIIFVLLFFVLGKWIHQYWVKPLVWKHKENKQGILTLFWDYDQSEMSDINLSFTKKIISFVILGFITMTSGTIFFLFLLKGQFQAMHFYLTVIIFIMSFRFFAQIVKSLGYTKA